MQKDLEIKNLNVTLSQQLQQKDHETIKFKKLILDKNLLSLFDN